MKFIIRIVCFFAIINMSAQVGIGTTSPDASSILDITSTDKGILVPRVSLTNVTSATPITSPTTSLLVWNTNAAVTGGSGVGFYYWSGSNWVSISGVKKIDDLLDGKSDNDGTANGSSVFLGIDAGLNDDSSDNKNVGIGYQALNSNTTGGSNTANGYQALSSNTTGPSNTANGYQALNSNTIGSSNTAVGHRAIRRNTTGSFNTAVGNRTLDFYTTGSLNTAVGYGSLRRGSIGSSNTAVGVRSGEEANGNNNVFLGFESGKGLNSIPTSGSVFLGYQSGYNETSDNKLYIENSDSATPLIYGEFDTNLLRINGTLDINNAFQFPTVDGTATQVLITDGSGTLNWGTATVTHQIDDLLDGKSDNDGSQDGSSIFLGVDAGLNDDSSDNKNVGIGYQALLSNISGNSNTANGYKALNSNTSGDYNTAAGFLALGANTTGSSNTANGYQALFSNTIGFSNTANGYISLYSNTTGKQNTAIGRGSLYSNTTGYDNIAIGHFALGDNTTGFNNTANGYTALLSNTTGSSNTANGYQALNSNSTGNSNTAIGVRSGELVNGNNNVFLGFESGKGTSANSNSGNVFLGYQSGYNETSDNKLYIENSGSATPLIYGEFDTNLLRINGTLDINNAYQFPTADGTANQVLQTDGSGTLNWGTSTVTHQINDLLDGKSDNDGSQNGSSIFLGVLAGFNDDSSDNKNVGIGQRALFSNTTGSGNIANGFYALFSNTTGEKNIASGVQALYSNTIGYNNTAYGYHALFSNTIGINNIANGVQALFSNTTGDYNTANGSVALRANTTGDYNTANGNQALYSNTTGIKNTAIGINALLQNLTGDNNLALGASAGLNNNSNNNVFLGYESGRGGVGLTRNTGSANVFLGYQSGYNEISDNKLYIENSSSATPLIYGEFDTNLLRINGTLDINNAYQFPTVDGTANQVLITDGSGALNWGTTTVTHQINDLLDGKSDNDGSENGSSIFLGVDAGLNDDLSDNKNVGIGFEVLKNNTTGEANVANGYLSLYSNTIGNWNTAAGRRSLYSNTEGFSNSAFGNRSLQNNTTGNNNTAIGLYALQANTIGSQNTAIAASALRTNVSGNDNVAVGFSSLYNNTIGSNNTAVGFNALSSNTTGVNNIGIGYIANVPNATGDNQVRIGNNAITYAGIQVAWTVTSDRRWKENIRELPYGLDFVKQLQPVDYIRKNNEHKTRETGFIAQDVEALLTKVGYNNQGILHKDDDGMLSLRYNDFIAILTKAIQEQQEIIEVLQVTVSDQQADIKSLTSEVVENKQIQNKTFESLLKRIVELENVSNQ